jgi:hypothetical protein
VGPKAAPREVAGAASPGRAGAATTDAAPVRPADEPRAPEPSASPAPATQDAPADEPGATPAAGPPAQELTLERVKRAWELVLQRVQTTRVPLYGFLRDGRPSALDGDALTVALPTDFALRNAAQGDNADVLAAAVEGVLGRRVTARFELAAGAVHATAPEAAPAAAPHSPAGPLPDFTDQIRAAQAKLDAELLPDDS